MKEMYLVTKLNGADRWVFANEEDILPSIKVSYSALDHKIELIGRDMIFVKVIREEVIKADVYTVNRIPVLYDIGHL